MIIVIVDSEKKRALDYSKLIEICGRDIDDYEDTDAQEIVVILNEGKNKAPNTYQNFQ
jgi:hypothetical protein